MSETKQANEPNELTPDSRCAECLATYCGAPGCCGDGEYHHHHCSQSPYLQSYLAMEAWVATLPNGATWGYTPERYGPGTQGKVRVNGKVTP